MNAHAHTHTQAYANPQACLHIYKQTNAQHPKCKDTSICLFVCPYIYLSLSSLSAIIFACLSVFYFISRAGQQELDGRLFPCN